MMRRLITFALAMALATAPLRAQDGTFTINLRDAEISVLAEQITEITNYSHGRIVRSAG